MSLIWTKISKHTLLKYLIVDQNNCILSITYDLVQNNLSTNKCYCNLFVMGFLNTFCKERKHEDDLLNNQGIKF